MCGPSPSLGFRLITVWDVVILLVVEPSAGLETAPSHQGLCLPFADLTWEARRLLCLLAHPAASRCHWKKFLMLGNSARRMVMCLSHLEKLDLLLRPQCIRRDSDICQSWRKCWRHVIFPTSRTRLSLGFPATPPAVSPRYRI